MKIDGCAGALASVSLGARTHGRCYLFFLCFFSQGAYIAMSISVEQRVLFSPIHSLTTVVSQVSTHTWRYLIAFFLSCAFLFCPCVEP